MSAHISKLFVFLAVFPFARAAPPQNLTGDWFQVWSDHYVQSTTEIDWKCVVARMEESLEGGWELTKHARLHSVVGPRVTTPTTRMVWKEAEAEFEVRSKAATAATTTYRLRELTPDAWVLTGNEDPSLYVFTKDVDTFWKDKEVPLLAQLDAWGYTDKYKTPLRSYDAECEMST